MNIYAHTDATIIHLIREGAYTFSSLDVLMPETEWRLIDRRLQALRKTGQIKFLGRKLGWRVSE